MQYRRMGSLGWEVSALGFGCMRLPTRRMLPGVVDPRESVAAIRLGIDRGINYLDTAYLYHLGRSETIVGNALGGGYRERVKLVTKLPVILARKPEDFDTYLHRQLHRLRTDCLDAYLLHGLNRGLYQKARRLGFVEKLERAREAGTIRHVGFSFHDSFPVLKEIIDSHPWDIVMVQHNYMDTGIQATSEGLAYAHGKGMAVVVMEPLKGGMLAHPPRRALAIMEGASAKRTPVEWALQFLWNKPEVSVVLSGMSSRNQVNQNCDSAERSGVGSLPPEDLDVIEQLAAAFRERIVVGCTGCGYCMPCPHGVDIPDCFAILNNVALAAQGNFAERYYTYFIRRRYRHKARSKAELQGKTEGGSAALCVACGACLPKCPQGIDIPAELKKVHAVLARGERVENYLHGVHA